MLDIKFKNLAKEIAKYMKEDKPKTSSYDTQAVVRRIEGNTAYVHIPGGIDETPVNKTIAAQKGDIVQVRVSGKKAFLVGNASAPPTDDATAIKAEIKATVAKETADAVYRLAEQAEAEANRAKTAADTAQEYAEEAKETTDEINAYAETAGKTVTQILNDGETAGVAAQEAKQSAENASEYASRALGNLSTVQSVSETLTWITQHGTMTLTSDQHLDPTHIYFVVDAQGDYVVGGTHYSIVAEPNEDDLSTYYELIIDESLNNYVGTHLALTNEGLWLIPDAGNGYKILISTGSVQAYPAGTYIIDGSDVVAKFGETVTIGDSSGIQSYLYEDYHSLQLKDKEGNIYFYISDLRDKNGECEVTNTFIGDGVQTGFSLNPIGKDNDYTVTVDGTEITSGITKTKEMVSFTTAPINNAVIVVTYTTEDYRTKAYTAGMRLSNTDMGVMSFAEGLDITASGNNSHAEGVRTTASGSVSHAEGVNTIANGLCSHTQGEKTIANKRNQTAIGRYNVEDTETATAKQKAFIIGNGTSDDNRSNAFTVDWGGNTEADGDITDGTGNVLSDKVDASSLATVATSGSYNDLANKPTIPTVNNATLTIQKNGINVQTFTANASSNKTANITVPTATSDLTNDSGFIAEDSNGDIAITRNITAGGKLTAEAINGNVLFDHTSVSLTTSSISANASGEVTSSTITNDGYYPIAFASISITTGVASLRRFYFDSRSVGSCKIKVGVQNDGTSAKTISLKATILWVKTSV